MAQANAYLPPSDPQPGGPTCSICSYRQPPPLTPRPVGHSHNSPREIRKMQGVEYSEENVPYMCTTCRVSHKVRPDIGLNILLGDTNLHNIHTPRGLNMSPPDPLHIDWLTISGATIKELEYAWQLDYGKYTRPMRILLSAGLADLDQGRSRNDIVADILHFRAVVNKQNDYHPLIQNEFVVATILNPPKLVWFEDNGPPPPNHVNLFSELKELNSWISYFNQQKDKLTPGLHKYGVKNGTQRVYPKEGVPYTVKVHHHLMKQWEAGPVKDRLYLSDTWKVRLGVAVVRHFEGELKRYGVLG